MTDYQIFYGSLGLTLVLLICIVAGIALAGRHGRRSKGSPLLGENRESTLSSTAFMQVKSKNTVDLGNEDERPDYVQIDDPLKDPYSPKPKGYAAEQERLGHPNNRGLKVEVLREEVD